MLNNWDWNECIKSMQFYSGLHSFKINEKYGFLNESGAIEIAPKYSMVTEFSNGLSAVRIKNLWGYIKSDGTWFIEPKFEDADSFCNNHVAIVSVRDHGIKKYGILKLTGEYLMEPTLLYAEWHGKLIFVKKDKDEYFFMDVNGSIWLNTIFSCLKYGGKSGHIKTSNSLYVETKNGEKGFLLDGIGWEFKLKAEKLQYYESYDLFTYELEGKWGILDGNGNVLVNAAYTLIHIPSEKYNPCKKRQRDAYSFNICGEDNSNIYFFNREGKIIYSNLKSNIMFNDKYDVFFSKEIDKWGCRKNVQEWVIEPEFDEVKEWIDGIGIVAKEVKGYFGKRKKFWAYVNCKGYITNFDFYKVEGLCGIKRNGNRVKISKDGTIRSVYY